METLFIAAAYLIISYAFGAFTETVAKEKGYRGIKWYWGGFFFWFIALIAAAGLPVKSEKKE